MKHSMGNAVFMGNSALLLLPYTKSVKDLNVKDGSLKLLEKGIGEYFYFLRVGKVFSKRRHREHVHKGNDW